MLKELIEAPEGNLPVNVFQRGRAGAKLTPKLVLCAAGDPRR